MDPSSITMPSFEGHSEVMFSQPRCYAAIPYLYHPNLATIQYQTFFNTCRLQGVAFDLRQRTGTAFLLMDSLVSGCLGILTAASSLSETSRQLQHALKFISEQAGSRAISGKQEFQPDESNFEVRFLCLTYILSHLPRNIQI